MQSIPDRRPQHTDITSIGYGLSAFILFVLMVATGAVSDGADAADMALPGQLPHFLAYAFLTGLIYHSLADSPIPRVLRALLFIALLAGLDEAVQATSLYRPADLGDWSLHMLAALACLVLLCGLRSLRNAVARKRGILHPSRLE